MENQFQEQDIIHFPGGIPGFENLTRFVLIEDPDTTPILWLLDASNPDLAFAVVEPGQFFSDYHIDLSDADQQTLKLNSEDEALVLVIITVTEDPSDLTANLMGPIIINRKQKIGKQLVLSDSGYPLRKHIKLQQTATCR